MKGAVVGFIVLLLSFSARADVRDQVWAGCHLDALRTYPAEEGPHSRKLDQYDLTCMRAKGFHFTIDPSECGRKRGDLFEDPGCYVRN